MAHRDYSRRGSSGRDSRLRPAPGERTPPLVSPPIPRARRRLSGAGRLFSGIILHVRTLVLGLGNPLLGDDAVGLKVAALVRDRLNGAPDVDVEEEEAGGLRLMERMTGYDRAVLVDAAVTGGKPGTITRLTPDDLPTQRTAVAHGIDLPRALALGRQLGYPMPSEVRIVAIEAESVLEFRHEMTPAVAAAVEPAVAAVLEELAAAPTKQASG